MIKEEKGLKEDMAILFNNPDRIKFKNLLQNSTGEYDDFDFKEEYIDNSLLSKHILAMANTCGGIIVFGIKDEDQLNPIGFKSIRDKSDIKNVLSNYLPQKLDYDIFDFQYGSESEWEKIKNKNFQIIVVDYHSENIPFLSKKDGINVKTQDIYVRKNTATHMAKYEDIQQILENRINNPINMVNQSLQEDLEQLKILCVYLHLYDSFLYSTFHGIIKGLTKIKIKKIKKELNVG